MKVVVSANGADLDGPSSPRFGRCPMFLFVDTESLEFEVVANPGADASGGAGIEAARFVADADIEALITGKVGPNALEMLEAARIPIYVFGGGSVREAVNGLKAGNLELHAGSEKIDTVTGAEGTVAEVLDAYLGDRLGGAQPCRNSVQHEHAHPPGQGQGQGRGGGRGQGRGQGRRRGRG